MSGRTTYHVYSPGLYYPPTPVFAFNRDLDNKQGFASLYGVSQQDAECIIEAGSTKGFAGCVWSERLWIDCDSYEVADKVESKLKGLGYDYVAYDTGGRGVHFGVLRDSAPSHLLPIQDRAWVQSQFPESEVDKSIYTPLHLFRLPGTVHASTGKPKVLVVRQSGKSLVHVKYVAEARVAISFSFDDALSDSGSVFDNFNVMAQTGPARNGNRHPSLVRLAYSLKAASVPVDKAYWWLCETNKMFDDPKNEAEIEKIVKDIF